MRIHLDSGKWIQGNSALDSHNVMWDVRGGSNVPDQVQVGSGILAANTQQVRIFVCGLFHTQTLYKPCMNTSLKLMKLNPSLHPNLNLVTLMNTL